MTPESAPTPRTARKASGPGGVIWRSEAMHDRSLRGWWYAVLRVLSITVTGFAESRIAIRAAALSFSTLLGLGPLLAIAVLASGFALGKNEPAAVADALSRMLKFIAPQLQEYERITKTEASLSPQVLDVINHIITASRSGSAGAFGAISLVLIVLLLFKSIEDTFNDIWGIRQGRPLVTRVVFYWTIMTLGALLFFSAVALLGAGTFVSMFAEKLPGGAGMLRLLSWGLPVLSLVFLTSVLTVFYRVIPNTRVEWRAALAGAVAVGTLALINNFLAFLYVKRVLIERSLYGGLALPLVIMSGMYVFWICVLTGGIVSYAVQNVHYRNSQAAWSMLNETMRERISLVVFLTICRRFHACLPPVSATQLGTILRVPTQLLNECLNRLVRMRLVATLRPEGSTSENEYVYQPARPLSRMTLLEFKTLDDNLGEDPIGDALGGIDPLIQAYDGALGRIGEQEFFRLSVETLLEQHPFGDSHPPFALGDRAELSPQRRGD